MGSVLCSLCDAIDAANDLKWVRRQEAETEHHRTRPAALLRWDGDHPLPLHEQRQIVQRWIDFEKRKGPNRTYLEGELHASAARPHAYIALRYYNSRHPGGEFDAVRPLMSSSVYFRGDMWFHVNFLARRRDCIDAPVMRFFAEVHYDWFNKPVMESCIMLQEEQLFVIKGETNKDLTPKEVNQEQELLLARYKSKCLFCDDHHGILHPGDEEFLCGKQGQENEMDLSSVVEDRGFDIILQKPKTIVDVMGEICYYLFSVFSIWLAMLASKRRDPN